MSTVAIEVEEPATAEIKGLLEASDAYMRTLYRPQSNHLLDVQALQEPKVIFVVARVDGIALGCGAVVRTDSNWAEIKRMFVLPSARGQKIGRSILKKLEELTRNEGYSLLRLETGTKQPEALSLYRSAGFVEIDPFGDYDPDPLSVFMEKQIKGDQSL